MRLIDADKLIVEVVHSGNIVCLPHFSLEQIDTAPIVKAIPIEWINKWVVTTNMGAGRTIDRLLEDWEKENEHKESD